ncbi:hypothetical protein BRD01_04175 [Halobacteriales archaeon QS_8_65_32]|jgi:hypothetical protein|nr:MAG: hypothetical protein BRD01_04175 [Halobacteriales archaeon QS_8_65_32]
MRIVLRSEDFEEREISQRTIEKTLGLSDPDPADAYIRAFAMKRARQQNLLSDRGWVAGVFDDENKLQYTQRPAREKRERAEPE